VNASDEKPLDVNRNWYARIVALVAVTVMSSRIVATHGVFSGTYDETVHLTAGVELLSDRTYEYSPMHPPVARLMAALGPWLSGSRYAAGEADLVTRVDSTMLAGPGYSTNLAMGRLGILPFFIATGLFLFLWARTITGEPGAAIAVVVLCLTPPVLAHSGLVTTDAASMATFVAAMYALQRWLEPHRLLWRSVLLGVAIGLAFGSKLSAIPFLAATGPLMIWAKLWESRRAQSPASSPVGFRHAAVAGFIALVTLQLTYLFTVPDTLGFPAPLSDYVFGLMLLAKQNMDGHTTYLLGETYGGSRLHFFPVALAVKTPIPILLLAAIGIAVAIRNIRRHGSALWTYPIIALGAVLTIAVLSNINLGVRHILPAYPALALLGAVGVQWLWNRSLATRLLPVALGSWLLWSTWRAHPDYLAWFNRFAGDEPGRVLVASDLDWGQDLNRLADTVRSRAVSDLSIAYYGFPDRLRQLFPDARLIGPDNERPVGWFAVSETIYRRGWPVLSSMPFSQQADSLEWLTNLEPVTRVGKSIRLYFIQPSDSARIVPRVNGMTVRKMAP
jgi:hypothetical protein